MHHFSVSQTLLLQLGPQRPHPCVWSDAYNPSKNDGFEGYTFFPLGEGPGPYSDGNYTDVVVNNSDSGRGGVPASIHHELRHVFLGDFGRSASKALHGTGNVDQQTKAAEDEAIKNQKDKP
jgi:hypothetical protein